MTLYNNVKIIDYGLFQQSRCFLDTFDAENDVNKATQRAGIRSHCWITALFLKIFGKIEEIKTTDGEIIYLNRASFEKWRLRHTSNMPDAMQTRLPSASTIIEYRKNIQSEQKKLAAQKVAEKINSKIHIPPLKAQAPDVKPEKITDPTPKNIEPYAPVIKNQVPDAKPEKIVLPTPKIKEIFKETEILEMEMEENTSNLSLSENEMDLDSLSDNDMEIVSYDEEISFTHTKEIALSSDLSKADSEEKGNKVLNVAKRWGMKLVPELIPELKAPLAILKSGTTIKDAVDSYQNGNTLGALKKVAPMAIGGSLLLCGGPVAATAFAAYKAYSLVNLVYDTANLMSGPAEAMPDPEDTVDDEEYLWV